MNRSPVYLTPTQRQLAVDAIITSLLKRNISAEIASVDRVHLHVLAPFPDHNPRHWIGIAKKESSHFLKIQAQGIDGGLWAVRCQCLQVENAAHAARTRNYIGTGKGVRNLSITLPMNADKPWRHSGRRTMNSRLEPRGTYQVHVFNIDECPLLLPGNVRRTCWTP